VECGEGFTDFAIGSLDLLTEALVRLLIVVEEFNDYVQIVNDFPICRNNWICVGQLQFQPGPSGPHV